MVVVTLAFVFASLSISKAAKECPPLTFWNGTACTPCSRCPPGSGVKTQCSSNQDTLCQLCWPGFDYSNTTSMEPCIPCNIGSNCLDGKPKVIKNCTRESPNICDGCADGFFFDPDAPPDGGCRKCSDPCDIFEVEKRKCTTAHDRECHRATTGRILAIFTSTPVPNSTSVGSTDLPTTGRELQSDQSRPDLQNQALTEKQWFWPVIVAVIILVLVPSAVLGTFIVRSRRTREKANHRSGFEQARPLMSDGLDIFVRDLSIDNKKFIAKKLNGKDTHGYYYWQIIAEKVGLQDESRDWGRADNPTEKLLTAFGEKEQGTIRNLIEALKEAGLTLFARDLKVKFKETKKEEHEVVTSV